MSKLYLQYGSDPFLFDTVESKLYQLKDRSRIEIKNSKMLKRIRLDSIEIDCQQAFKLAAIHREHTANHTRRRTENQSVEPKRHRFGPPYTDRWRSGPGTVLRRTDAHRLPDFDSKTKCW